MILNCFEENLIKNSYLPQGWQSQKTLYELEEFLQRNWEQRSVFYDDSIIESRQQFLGFSSHGNIRTKRYIGTIVYRGEQLNIYPKMFRSESDDQDTTALNQDHLMRNLIQWLNYCNRMSYPFLNIDSGLEDSSDLRELFFSLFVGYVKSALDRGLFYHYIEETEDIDTIKGRFDLQDYVQCKIPNGMANRFRCTYSKFEFDNWINRVIKYTCKQIINSTSPKNQKALRSILMRLNDVSDVACVPSDCDRIRLSKMNGNYRMIVSLCRMFLLNKTSGLTMDINESFCFLFPTDLLFEGFIGGFIKETVESKGGNVRLQQSDMHLIEDIRYGNKSLGAAFTMRHDIVVEHNGKIFILDTKYKPVHRFEGDLENVYRVVSNEPKQTDIYQVCEYARKRGVSDVYLLYPMYRHEEKEPNNPVGESWGDTGKINIHFVRMPFIFEENSENTKAQLISIISDLLNI